jgi:hypothetical protein
VPWAMRRGRQATRAHLVEGLFEASLVGHRGALSGRWPSAIEGPRDYTKAGIERYTPKVIRTSTRRCSTPRENGRARQCEGLRRPSARPA